jgi:hypothetical protein
MLTLEVVAVIAEMRRVNSMPLHTLPAQDRPNLFGGD